MSKPRLAPVLIGAGAIGIPIWAVLFGFVHAYGASVDWDAIAKDQVMQVFTAKRFVNISIMGFVIGITAQSVAVLGGALRREGLTLFGPMLAGLLLGVLQGFLVATDWWGYTTSGIPLRSLTTRLIAGALCGLLSVPIIMTASVISRRQR